MSGFAYNSNADGVVIAGGSGALMKSGSTDRAAVADAEVTVQFYFDATSGIADFTVFNGQTMRVTAEYADGSGTVYQPINIKKLVGDKYVPFLDYVIVNYQAAAREGTGDVTIFCNIPAGLITGNMSDDLLRFSCTVVGVDPNISDTEDVTMTDN